MTDVDSEGYGLNWGHTRTYSNTMSEAFTRGNGWNWNVEHWPFLRPTEFPGNPLVLLGNLYDLIWFQPNESGGYTTLFGRLHRLVHDEEAHEFRMSEADGTVTVFNDLTHAVRPGLFKSATNPGGNKTEVVNQEGSDLLEVERSETVDGETIKETYRYTFSLVTNNLEQVELLRTGVSGALEPVLKSEYSYFEDGDVKGELNDLEEVIRSEWTSTGWVERDRASYRYWTAFGGDDYAGKHLIKYVVGPEAYRKMVADGRDPLTDPDDVIALYADNYYNYDAQRRCIEEVADAGSRRFLFEYGANPNFDPETVQDFNFWARKTVETLPDGVRNVVYTNRYGQTMLKIVTSPLVPEQTVPDREWCEFTRFDPDGRVVLEADSASIESYDETLDDLLGYDPDNNTFQKLKNDTGLIRRREYYTEDGSGGAKGHLKQMTIQNGQSGSIIPLQLIEYGENTADGVTVHPITREVVYPEEGGSSTIETLYSHEYHSGTNQVYKKTTTLPLVSSSQNGPDSTTTRDEVYDLFGNPVWTRDERGFIGYREFDTTRGVMTRRIDDAQVSGLSDVPTGWATPADGGLHLVSDFEYDRRGRITQSLGPEHAIASGAGTLTVRAATWTVYKDAQLQRLTGRGYAEVVGESTNFTLVNPVGITISDRNGNVLEQIAAMRGSGTTSSGKLVASDTFSSSSYVRWTVNEYSDCCKLVATRVYHSLAAVGGADAYDRTTYGYDLRNRRNSVTTPGGTITMTVYDERSLEKSIWVGTNATGATETDPSGGGGGGNNMVLVTEDEYDGGSAGGNGNLTKTTQHVDAMSTRETTFTYDWRNRRLSTTGEESFYEAKTYDNLDRILRIDRRDGSSSGTLLARSDTLYDDRSRVYRTISYEVDPTSGAVGASLSSDTWYDETGNVAKSQAAGSQVFTKTKYDGVGRPVARYLAVDADETSYADVFSVSDDTVLEQSETTYDAASNPIVTTTRLRHHDATGLGELTTPQGAQPRARVTYTASWQDGIGRTVAAADYGTNGGTALSRPAVPPAASDTVLVSKSDFNAKGELWRSTDPSGLVVETTRDAAGRVTKTVENPQSGGGGGGGSGSGCAASSDANRESRIAYNADGNVASTTAVNTSTGNQTTVYEYGTTLSDSGVASSVLLRRTLYPDSTGSSDSISAAYNRQGEVKSTTDQRGCVHQYDRDGLGRVTADRVTTLGTGTDGTVRRIETAYDVRGLVDRITSYDNATVGSGTVLNEVVPTYNGFGQVTSESQSHTGAVNVGTTPRVQYTYADGSSNTIRPTGMTYPNGRVVTYSYGTAGTLGDLASRVTELKEGASARVEYGYLGLSGVVTTRYPEPGVTYTLVGTAGGVDSDTGDIYHGLDRFGRVKDAYWHKASGDVDVARIQYGYDRASNRTWRYDAVARSQSKSLDELYQYDGLQRLKSLDRGQLDTPRTGLESSSGSFGECWTLDETGNWKGYRRDHNGDGSWDVVQSRTSNGVNEITATTGTPTPAYDAAGNMTSLGSGGGTGWAELTLGDWSDLELSEWAAMPLTSGGSAGLTATYDAWNRLVKLSRGTETVRTYRYDGRKYRIAVGVYSGGSLSTTRHLYYSNDWRVLEERVVLSGSGTAAETTAPAERQFLWGTRYIDDLVLRDRDADGNSTLDERKYALQDANWNVIALTDTGGTVDERYAYSAYGEPAFLNSSFTPTGSGTSARDWETLYAGYRHEPATGLFHVRNRAYAPGLGVWLQRDPVADPHAPSLYAYGNGRPLVTTDQFGLQSFMAPTSIQEFGGYSPSSGFDTGNELWRGPAQGAANIANGVQDSAVGLLNTPAVAWNYSAGWLLDAQAPYIPSPDWSKDRFVPNDPCHDLGKFLGGEGATFYLPTKYGKAFGGCVSRCRDYFKYGDEATKTAEQIAKWKRKGFTDDMARDLAKPYNGEGHHGTFRKETSTAPRGKKRQPGPIPDSLVESDINILKPSGISKGDFYELHMSVDPTFRSATASKGLGISAYTRQMFGLENHTPSFLDRNWRGTTTEMKIIIGGGAGGAMHQLE